MSNVLALYVDTVIIWLALFSHNTTNMYTDRIKQKTIDTLIPRTNGHSRFTCDLLIYMAYRKYSILIGSGTAG